MKKKIAIIGAGIAGLTLANLIKKNSDHEFMLYEKQESLNLPAALAAIQTAFSPLIKEP